MTSDAPRRRLITVATAPTLMTLGNLLCGFMAVFWASRPSDVAVLGHFSPLSFAATLVFLGMVFDALDGAVARLVRSSSSFGAQLDSMADMVTFGLAPAFIVVQLNDIGAPFFASDPLDTYFGRLVLLIAGVYAACCALRLARFTVEAAPKRLPDHNSFAGLPSPGAAGTVCGLVLVYLWLIDHGAAAAGRGISFTIIGVQLLVALAMVSRLPYPHVINRYLHGRRAFTFIALFVVAAMLLLTVPQPALAAAFVVYAISGALTPLRRDRTGKRAPA